MTDKTIQAIIKVFGQYPVLTLFLLIIIGGIFTLVLLSTGRLTIGRKRRYEYKIRIADSFALGRELEALVKEKIKRQMDEAEQTILRIEDIALKHFLILKKRKRGSKEGLIEDKETGHYGAFLRAGLKKTKEKYLFFLKKNNFAKMRESVFRTLVQENVGLLIKEMTDYLNWTWRGEDIPYSEIKAYKEEIKKRYKNKANSLELIRIVHQHIVEFVEDWHKNKVISREELYDHNLQIRSQIEKEIESTLWEARSIAQDIAAREKEVLRKIEELKKEACLSITKKGKRK
jgi:hypothetical protein